MPSATQTSTDRAPDARPGRGPADPATALRALLREATRERHAALDARFEGLAESDGPAPYHRFVLMNALAFAGLVPAVLASPLGRHAGIAASLRASLAALEADRAAMRLPSCRAPAFARRSVGLCEAVGIAYVLEGSKLGARYLHRQLAGRAADGRWGPVSLGYLAEADASFTTAGLLAGLGLSEVAEPAGLLSCREGADAAFRHFAAVLDAVESGTAAGPCAPAGTPAS